MQTFAIVVSLAIAAVGIALFVRAIRSIIGVMKVGQPTRRTDNPAGAVGDDAQGDAAPHPDAAVDGSSGSRTGSSSSASGCCSSRC